MRLAHGGLRAVDDVVDEAGAVGQSGFGAVLVPRALGIDDEKMVAAWAPKVIAFFEQALA